MKNTSKEKLFFNKERLSRIVICVLVAFAFSFAVFIVAPFDIFANNLEEFNFSFSDFAGSIIALFFICAFFVFGVLFCLPKKAYKFFLAFFLATAALLFIQQNFLNFGMNSLPGDNLASEGPSVFVTVLDLLLWIVAYVAAFVLAALKDKKGNVNLVALVLAVVLFASQIVSPIFIAVSNGEMFKTKLERSGGELEAATVKNYASPKSDGNVYYFCVDRFDELYAEQAYSEYPDIYKQLDGFTWFQDNVSVYGHTFPAIANMLTTKEYDAKSRRADYLNTAYEGDTPLKRLNEAGYEVNLYTQPYYAYTEAQYLPDYVENVLKVVKTENPSPFKLSFILTSFSLYRGAPILVKKLIKGESSSTINAVVKMIGKDSDGADYYGYSTDTKQAYLNAIDSEKNQTNGKQFSFIHFEGCHEIDYDDAWNKATFSDTIAVSVKNSFKIVNEFIKMLKDKGLYENATIIITGDHSNPVSDVRELRESRRTALFVKPRGVDGEFKISSAQTSHKDIWATIFKSEGLDYTDYGTSVFDISETENRVRKYVWHTYATDLDEYVYEINGKASDFSKWKMIEHTHYDKFIMN